MSKGAVPPALVVIDLQEPGTQAHLLRSLLGSGVLGWTGIGASPWLVLAPPGDGGADDEVVLAGVAGRRG